MTNINNKVDVLIVGGGVCGLFVLSKFEKLGFNVLLIESSSFLGGQCNLYLEKKIYNIPLFDEITSREVVEKVVKNVNKSNILLEHQMSSIEEQRMEEDESYLVNILDIKNRINKQISCKYVILACGNGDITYNKIQIENAKYFENKTLFYYIKNEKIFKNKDIILTGGGDSVIDWCTELHKIANSITIIHRREINKKDNPNFVDFQQLINNNKIKLYHNHSIKNIIGDIDNGTINNITIINNEKNEEEISLKTDYLLVFYGLKSNLNINFNKLLNVCEKNMMSEKYKNIFAIGDCANYDGKIKNIPISLAEAMKCFIFIVNNEKQSCISSHHI